MRFLCFSVVRYLCFFNFCFFILCYSLIAVSSSAVACLERISLWNDLLCIEWYIEPCVLILMLFSASEVTTFRRYTNLCIIIISWRLTSDITLHDTSYQPLFVICIILLSFFIVHDLSFLVVIYLQLYPYLYSVLYVICTACTLFCLLYCSSYFSTRLSFVMVVFYVSAHL